MNQINEKFGATFEEQVKANYASEDAAYPTMEEIQALKEHMKSQKQKRDADPEAWNINVGFNGGWGGNFNFNYGCGWQNRWSYLQYPGLFDYNPCNWFTGFGLYNNIYNCPNTWLW